MVFPITPLHCQSLMVLCKSEIANTAPGTKQCTLARARLGEAIRLPPRAMAPPLPAATTILADMTNSSNSSSSSGRRRHNRGRKANSHMCRCRISLETSGSILCSRPVFSSLSSNMQGRSQSINRSNSLHRPLLLEDSRITAKLSSSNITHRMDSIRHLQWKTPDSGDR